MPDIENQDERVFETCRPPVVGGTDGVVTPISRPAVVPDVTKGNELKPVHGTNGSIATSGSNGKNGNGHGKNGTNGHKPVNLFKSSRRAQLVRAYHITRIFISFIVWARFGRLTSKDIDKTIRAEAVRLRHVTEELGGTFIKLAQQASASVVVSLGDTTVLATVVMSPDKRAGIDFFPLSVEYEERYYAAGAILGSRFMRREGRPSDEAVLSADGLRKFQLTEHDRVTLTSHENPIYLAQIEPALFTDRLVAKFKLPVEGWRGE